MGHIPKLALRCLEDAVAINSAKYGIGEPSSSCAHISIDSHACRIDISIMALPKT